MVPNTLGATHLEAAAPSGRLNVAVRWPARGEFRAQLIPTSANMIRIQVRDVAGELMARAEFIRPGDESTIATASFALSSGTGRSVLVQAFRELVPAPGVAPVAEGSSTGITIWPSTSAAVTVTLVPTLGPVIYDMTPNGGPGSLVRIVGGNFQTGPLLVRMAGRSIDPFVTLRGDLLEFEVPPDAQDGPVEVDVDGVKESRPFQVIRSITLAQDAFDQVATGSVVNLVAEARTASGQLIREPELGWLVDRPAPESSLAQGAFTPLATGTFVVRVYSGTIVATASVKTP
ncbi:MAG TPA: IPT/TIG domain-containing protein [Pantanalinema sp.]